MVNKSSFNSSLEFVDAIIAEQFKGRDPIDPKMASSCHRDLVNQTGLNSSQSEGVCPLDDVGCTYSVDKLYGESGHCVKRALGTRSISDPDIASKIQYPSVK